MKKTIEERMAIAKGRIEAVSGINELIQTSKEYDFYTPDESGVLSDWQVHNNAVAQAKIEAYLEMINTLLD